MNTEKVLVGSNEIEVTIGHIYLYPHLPKTYDYVPWNVIRHIISDPKLDSVTLIDIGANVGDSLAHYRRYSDGHVVCIEPAENFFAVLSRNAQQFSNVTLINSLLVPDDMVGKVAFSGNDQTGETRAITSEAGAWQGNYVTFAGLMATHDGPLIIKTDTDGFDAEIVKSAIPHLKSGKSSVAAIYFEGPSELQMRDGDYIEYAKICDELVNLGYGLLFLTNAGMPYTFVNETGRAIAVFASLETGYRQDMALCHYYDIIAVRSDLITSAISLTEAWPSSMFDK